MKYNLHLNAIISKNFKIYLHIHFHENICEIGFRHGEPMTFSFAISVEENKR